jgi:hypothetical protein
MKMPPCIARIAKVENVVAEDEANELWPDSGVFTYYIILELNLK